MTRTKWLRLGVRDVADILRWAGTQNVRRLDDFRHREIGGQEFISFRMVPRYAIEIGTSDIVVLAYVRGGAGQRVAAAFDSLRQYLTRHVNAALAALRSHGAAPFPAHTAELYQFAPVRRSLPSRR
jgi:hypothetical protein